MLYSAASKGATQSAYEQVLFNMQLPGHRNRQTPI